MSGKYTKRPHIMRICPRGFLNEAVYVSASDAEFAEADAYLNLICDNVNDRSKWLEPGTKLVNGARINYIWPTYRATLDPGFM